MSLETAINIPTELKTIYEKTGRLLCTASMIDNPPPGLISDADLATLKTLLGWVRSDIMKVVNKNGRKEAVCPFAKPAEQQELMYFSIAKPSSSTVLEAITEEVAFYGEIFSTIKPKPEPMNLLQSILVVFPDVPGPLVLPAVDREHTDLRAQMLRKNIMIGEFYPDCPHNASWDKKVFPLQSPMPFYVVRRLIESDWAFIHKIPEWREIYLERFGEPKNMAYYALPRTLQRLLDRYNNTMRR